MRIVRVGEQYCIDCKHHGTDVNKEPCKECMEMYEQGGPIRVYWEKEDEGQDG